MSKPPTTVQLDPQTAQALMEQAAALGLTVSDFLKRHFAAPNGEAPIADPDHWLDELVDGLPQLSPLPSDFSTRDIYADHD